MIDNIKISGSGTAMAIATGLTAIGAGISDIDSVGNGLAFVTFVFGFLTVLIEYMHIRKNLILADKWKI